MTTTNDPVERFQIPLQAAEQYEAAFVPAFFAQWAPPLCEAAGVSPGQAVLDVGCGTGIVARTAADLVGPEGAVTGVDLNEAMLTVARRVRPAINWRQADVAALPFPDASFDVVLSQMAMMFFADRQAALAELRRVVRPGGAVAICVPGALDHQPAFAPFVATASQLLGQEAAALLTSYFTCGDRDELTDAMTRAGLTVTVSEALEGRYRAPSVDAAVTTEVESTPLAGRISPEDHRRLREGAREVLAPFVASDGGLDAPFEANLVVGRR